MNQRKYVMEMIGDLGLSGSEPAWTPLEFNQKFTTNKLNDLIGIGDDELLEDKGKYQKLIGKLLYLTPTRLDISFAV